MTISTTSNTVSYVGDGSNTNFPFTFEIPAAADLEVILTTTATGATTTLGSSTYSVSGLGNPSGGAVTYPLVGSPISSSYTLTVQRIMPLTQTTDLVNQSAYYPEVVEDALDKLTMIDQQLQEQIDRALAFPVGTVADVPTLMAAILSGSANATSAAASATSAASSLTTLLAQLPVSSSNIQDGAVTVGKLASNVITAIKLATSSMAQVVGMINGTFTVSAAAGALTIALKTLAGTDPSATDPVYIIFRNATATSGDYTVITVTAANSFTISSGSTLGETSTGVAFSVWIVGFNDSGTFRLGAVRASVVTSTTYDLYPLIDNGIVSSTAEGGAGAADSAGVFYTGTAVTSKAYRVLGTIEFNSGFSVLGTWINPDQVDLYRPGGKLPGDIVQRGRTITTGQQNTTTAIPYDDSIPQNTEGAQFLSRSITPKLKSSVLRVSAKLSGAATVAAQISAALFQDSTANALVCASDYQTTPSGMSEIEFEHFMLANQTTSTTFNIRAGNDSANNLTLNGYNSLRKFGGVLSSFIEVQELKG